MLANIPFGTFRPLLELLPCPAIAIGTKILDLQAFTEVGGFSNLPEFQPLESVFTHPSRCYSLNAFAALGPRMCETVRAYLQEVLTAGGKFPDVLEKNDSLQALALRPSTRPRCVLRWPRARLQRWLSLPRARERAAEELRAAARGLSRLCQQRCCQRYTRPSALGTDRPGSV